MAKEQAIYEIVPEFSEMVEKLISLNEDRWGHIDGKMVRLAVITNKEAPQEPLPLKIIRIPMPVALVCPIRYMVVTWQQVWDESDEDRRALLICKVLEALEPDENEPKIKVPDEKNFKSLLRTFGVDYEINPSIKGLMSKPIEWVDAPVYDSDDSDKKTKDEAPDFGAGENEGDDE